MVSTPGVTYRMFRALSDEKINILAISTSEIKLSVIIDEKNILKYIINLINEKDSFNIKMKNINEGTSFYKENNLKWKSYFYKKCKIT